MEVLEMDVGPSSDHPWKTIVGTWKDHPDLDEVLENMREYLLDTGADDTVFHTDDAALLGIDLTNAPTGTAPGVTGQSVTVRYAEVLVQLIHDDGDSLEWRATVAFAPQRGTHPLLGFAGFLQFFNASFSGEFEEVTLTPNRLMPTTTP